MNITDIKHTLSLETVLRHYNLTPDKNNRLTCPWHPDKTPSLQLYPKTNSWTCFSSNCNAGSGDQIDFIMKYENISKYEAIQKATSLIGHTTPAPIPTTTPKEEKPKEELPEATLSRTACTELSRSETLQLALDYFTVGIKSNSTTAKNYIQSRGLEKLSAMGNYPMGYNSGQLHHRENSKYIPDYVNVGLLQNNPSGGYRVFAKHCLMFPLKNKDGQVVSFYGRSIAATGKNKHYYLKNSQGLYPAYPPAGTQKLLITESIIDTATLLQINSITSNFTLLAAYGTNRLTQEHLEAISRLTYLGEIVFFFDGDDAGRRAATKYAEQIHFLLPKVSISHIETPDDEDPNSLYVTYEEGYILELLNNRKQLYSTEGKAVKEEKSEAAPKLNSKNHEALVYETTELHFIVLGGIKISGLERMKVTLKIAVKNSHYAPIRQHLDLYNNEQLTRLVRTINEQLDVKTEVIREGLLALIEELEAYSIILLSCSPEKTRIQPSFNLCQAISLSEYSSQLFTDTLQWKDDTATINWHKPYLNNILVEVEKNCNDSAHLVYPFKPFDNVTYYDGKISISGKELNANQIQQLLEIINNPLYFGWGETTFEKNQKIIFEYKGKEIAKIDMMDNWIMKSKPENLLMKFGALNSEGKAKFNDLLNQLTPK